MQALVVIGGTVFVWALLLGVFFLLYAIPYAVFLPLYYVLHVGVFVFLAHLFRKAGVRYHAGVITVVVVGTLLALQLFYGTFVYPASAWQYLTVANWLIPAILAAVAMYIAAQLTQSK